MKRLQIMIDEDLDDRLAWQAAKEGVSRAELIRRYVRSALSALPTVEDDPLWKMVGAFEGDAATVDDVLYPR